MRTASSLLLLLVFAGCGSRQFVLESGDYQLFAAAGWRGSTERDLLAASMLHIDRAARSIRLSYEGELSGSFTPVDESTWPDGCPTNLSSATMEVATLSPASWTLRSLHIDNAVLVAQCGVDPPSRGVLLLPSPVERHQPLCNEGGNTSCLAFAR